MQWWNQRRSLQAQRQANLIRDRLVQELFSLRRSLELAVLNPVDSDHYQQWLVQVEELQRSLLDLSHELAPPYLEASLPLALQYEIEQRKVQYPQLRFEIQLEHCWQQNSLEQNQVIIGVLSEWCSVNLPLCDQKAEVAMTLEHHNNCNTLMIQANYSSQERLEAILNSVELQHLRRVFELLVLGKTEVKQQGQQAIWYFFWKREGQGLSM